MLFAFRFCHFARNAIGISNSIFLLFCFSVFTQKVSVYFWAGHKIDRDTRFKAGQIHLRHFGMLCRMCCIREASAQSEWASTSLIRHLHSPQSHELRTDSSTPRFAWVAAACVRPRGQVHQMRKPKDFICVEYTERKQLSQLFC